VRSWTWTDTRIAAPRLSLTDRAGRWVTAQLGRQGRSVAELARELGCDWHTVDDAVIAHRRPLVEDPGRFGEVTALGLARRDAFLPARCHAPKGVLHRDRRVGADGAQMLDVIEGRDAKGSSRWIADRPEAWQEAVVWGALDLSSPYRKAFLDALPHARSITSLMPRLHGST
jgi:hypothetical protein